VIRIDVHSTGETRPIRHICFPCQSTYVRHTLPTGSPRMWQPFVKSSTTMNRATAPEKKVSQHNSQCAGWPIRGSVPSFSPKLAIKAVGVESPFVSNQLLGLSDPYHRHAIGTFNTCSWGSTHRSLTDTSKGYNLRGVGFPHTIPWSSWPAVSTFP
jgi:hypothetical protein